ncbi:hypothetical protein VNO77_21214 [Canavalia gladiata]|uniref:Uncharacterized protein n=1 Tax=Canavalia gladiata TaxID=3824 RepID=A0AAN9LVR2_CANGL
MFLGCLGVRKGTYANRFCNLIGHELSSNSPLFSQLSKIVNQGKLLPFSMSSSLGVKRFVFSYLLSMSPLCSTVSNSHSLNTNIMWQCVESILFDSKPEPGSEYYGPIHGKSVPSCFSQDRSWS